jgi:hypothetical protein
MQTVKCIWWPPYTTHMFCPVYTDAEEKMSYNLDLWGIKSARGSVVVKALEYKPEIRGFESRWGEILNLPNPSGHIRPWGLLSI